MSTALHPTPPQHHRFHLLDGLRGLAAVLVVCFHAPYPFQPAFARYSFLAVDFFFCLSGFVIAFSYERRLADGFGLRRFLTARAIRLYPVFLLGIVTGALLYLVPTLHSGTFGQHAGRFVWWRDDLLPSVSQLFMLPTLPRPLTHFTFEFDFPAWSILYEVMANIAYAIAVVRGRASTRWLVASYVFALAGLVGWVVSGRRIDVGGTLDPSALTALLRVAMSFCSGVLMLRLFRRHTPMRRSTRATACALAATAGIWLLLTAPLEAMHSAGFQLFAAAALFPAIVYLAACCPVPASAEPLCSLLGEISYPLYLLQLTFLRPLQLHGANAFTQRHPGSAIAGMVLAVVAAALYALAVSRFYDIPVRAALVRRFNRPRTATPQRALTSA